ncbi:MAG: DUF4174 domain-containing protein [Cyclobacteriaceae bacterium]|nr:DUF4174 domain-containing protein [Cyclobacteriaceae bacterium]UYN85422.1 MAG: DUF4174 domain-containing protein [Cyclobacteriaceae bacterium]
MRKFLLKIFPLLIAANLQAQSGLGQYRLIYLFGDSTQVVKQQRWLSSDAAGCKERSIKIILADSSVHGQALYRQFNVTNPVFTLILMGKDGGEKFRSYEPVTPHQLFAIIDQMPMRKQELKLRPNH